MAQPQTIARPYAKAIFALASNDSEQQQWQHFLQVAAELVGTPDVMQHMHTPGFIAQLHQWLDDYLQQAQQRGLNAEEQNFLRLLETHGRMAILPEIATAFTTLTSASQNRCIAHIKSAATLDEQAQQTLVSALEQKLGKSVVLEIEEAPELLAGVMIEYDGQVIDQSLRGRLQQFARKLDD